uniref:Cupin type-1 domain-containing protein n=1 Tax=Glycine max TaxID=3847 RepID=A0A0R0HYM3_SOYBN
MIARFPLLPLLLLGIVFLASVSVSLQVKPPSHHECLQSCESETDPYKRKACKLSCKFVPEHGEQQHEEEEREREHPQPHPPHEERGRRERGRQEGEKEEKEQDERELQPRPFPRPEEHEGEQWKGRHRHEDPEERARMRLREAERIEREREEQRVREEEEKLRRREKKEQREEKEEEGQGSEDSHSKRQNNPFHFSSNRFQTLFKNQHGHLRVLQRFDQRSPQLENLRDYRVVELMAKPNTLFLPHHADADFLLLVLSGRALINLVKPDDRDPYYLDRGYAQRIPAGTTVYLVNPDKKKDLRVIKLAIPVNKPGNFEDFFLSSTQDQQSYLQGFSENILEASFNTKFEEINRVLFGGEGRRHQQEGVILELSKEQIRELSKRAKSSSRSTNSFDYEPFYLRGSQISSNNFGKFYEITPEKNPQLRDFDILLNTVDINELVILIIETKQIQGGLLLPHYNSKAIVILMVTEGEANIELVGLKEQQQGEETREVRKYRAELSEDDIFVIPAAYPFVVNATSNLNFVAFGINAENNQRNFLAGSKDNVIRQIQKQVKELAFPAGSAQDIENLIKNQRESYFADAQPLQKEEGKKGSFVF